MPDQPHPPLSASVPVDGNAVRQARIALGETCTAFAGRVPMSITYLSKVERGTRRGMSPPKFKQLVRALGMEDREHELIRSAA